MSAASRDLVGYANQPPKFEWPKGRRLALSIVVNYEEGSEHSQAADKIIEGIGEFLPIDVPQRDLGNESAYDYGQRVGVWRILRALKEQQVPATFFATGKALDANRKAAKSIISEGHEVCDHGYRWTEHYRYTYRKEKEAISKSVAMIEEVIGKKPVGFYAREPSVNTVKILEEFSNFIYDSDTYSDDLPYRHRKGGILMLPYTPDANDFHFLAPMHRFATATDFFTYLKDSFDTLHEESQDNPKMMSVGLHCRISGRPGRISAIRNFLTYAGGFDDVWVATREQIARHWIDVVEPTLR